MAAVKETAPKSRGNAAANKGTGSTAPRVQNPNVGTFEPKKAPAGLKESLSKKGSTVRKTSQDEIMDLFKDAKNHTLQLTGKLVSIAQYDRKANAPSTTDVDVFLQTTTGVKVPINSQHAEEVMSITKDSKVNFNVIFNALKVNKLEDESDEDYETRSKNLMAAAKPNPSGIDSDPKGFYLFADVTIQA